MTCTSFRLHMSAARPKFMSPSSWTTERSSALIAYVCRSQPWSFIFLVHLFKGEKFTIIKFYFNYFCLHIFSAISWNKIMDYKLIFLQQKYYCYESVLHILKNKRMQHYSWNMCWWISNCFQFSVMPLQTFGKILDAFFFLQYAWCWLCI